MMSGTQEMLLVAEEWSVARHVIASLELAGYGAVVSVSAQAALAATERQRPSLAILDADAHLGEIIELGLALDERDVPVMYLAGGTDLQALERLAHARPAGVLIKPFTREQLVGSVHVARSGAASRTQATSRAAVERISQVLVELGFIDPGAVRARETRETPELRQLSVREWEVLRQLLSHQRVPSIAKRLHISPATVRNHLKSIYTKLGVHSQQELLQKLVHVA
jgi:DNA-binding NarL/FixJ family response regulator